MTIKQAITIVLILTCVSYGNDNNEITPDYCQSKIKSFGKLKKGGIATLVGGICMSTTGLIMVSNADAAYYHVEYYADGSKKESGDPVGGYGSLLSIIGIPYMAGGIVMIAIGNKKQNEYRDKLKELTNLSYDIGINSICLRYEF